MIQEIGRPTSSIKILINSPNQSLKLKRAVPTGCIRITNKNSTHYNRYKSIDQLIIILFLYIYIYLYFILCIYICVLYPAHFESLLDESN